MLLFSPREEFAREFSEIVDDMWIIAPHSGAVMGSEKIMLNVDISVPLHSLALLSSRQVFGDSSNSEPIPHIIADRLRSATRPITETSSSDLRDYLIVASGDAVLPLKISVDAQTRDFIEDQKKILSAHLSQEISDSQAVMIILIDFILEHAAAALVNKRVS